MIEAGDEKLAVVMEAAGFYFWIYDLIVARGHEVMVLHPTIAKDDAFPSDHHAWSISNLNGLLLYPRGCGQR